MDRAPFCPRIFDTLMFHADRVALRLAEREVTYRELDWWSSALATQIKKARAYPVGLLSPSRPDYFAGLIAIWKSGEMALPLQPSHPIEELEYLLEDSRARQVFVHPECRELADRLRPSRPEVEWVDLTEPKSQPTARLANPNPDDGALMIYTSGTTGKPKGVVTSYLALDSQIETLLNAWEWQSQDRTLNILPLHHVHGVVVLGACALSAGARMELADKFSAELVWDRLVRQDINVFMAVPTVYVKLVEFWQKQTPSEQTRLSEGARALRLAACGSAALPEPLFEAWKKIAGTPLLERYGMTEIGMALSNPLHGNRKAGAVGRPLPGVEVRLVGEDGEILTANQVSGELQVRGENVFQQYWGQPEASKETFSADGWFKTGDVAERDSEGDYRILGRKSQDIIKTGGYKVSALEIENRLLEHPDLLEVAVVGLSDEVWGERVAAFVVLRRPSSNELNEDSLTQFLKPKLAKYKIPTVWRFCENLPRNAMGKVLKPKLRTL